MRRQHIAWTYLVLALVLSIYGGYSVFSSIRDQKDVPALGIVFFALGLMLLIIYFGVFMVGFIKKKLHPVKKEEPKAEEKEEAEEKAVEEKPKPTPAPKYEPRDDVTYERVSRPARREFGGDSGYVRLVGYGPVLRIEEAEILDMRNNTYYKIEDNYVKQSGYGPVFEIRGNQIRSAYGGYLYEISGSSVNKVYGGYYASMSGGTLQTHDLKEKYEIPSSMNMRQKLAVVALLFGTY